MFRQWNIKSHSCSRVQVPSMLFPKPFVNVQVSLSFKNTDSTNARNVRNFNNFSRDDCQILFCLLQDFHAKAFLTFTSFSVVSINAPNYLKLSTFLMFSFLTDFKTLLLLIKTHKFCFLSILVQTNFCSIMFKMV